MRNRNVFAAALVAIMLALGLAEVQASGGHCVAPLCAYQDIPATGAAVPSANLLFAGWSLNLQTMLPAASFVLYRTNVDGTNGQFVPAALHRVPRPDVKAAFGPNTPLYTGYHLRPIIAQPAGTFRYTTLVTDAPFQSAIAITETVIVQ